MSLSRLQWALLALAAFGQSLIASYHLTSIENYQGAISVTLSANTYDVVSTGVIFVITAAGLVALWRQQAGALLAIALASALAGAFLSFLLSPDETALWPLVSVIALGAAFTTAARARFGDFHKSEIPDIVESRPADHARDQLL